MRVLLFIIPVFLFLGCNKSSQIDLRSTPEGARIYDTNSKKFIAKTPAEVEYIFDNDPRTPECEVIPPITAVWDDYEAVVTKRDIILCPGRDYKLIISQDSFRKPIDYQLVKYKDSWSIEPYFAVNVVRSSIDVNILKTSKGVSDKSTSHIYKLGFIDDDNNRIEFSYSTLSFQEEDLNLYFLDTVIPVMVLKKEIVEPYFKFGLGYSTYTYANSSYENLMYKLGIGVYGYIFKNIELDLGLATTAHINYASLAEEGGFYSTPRSDTKIDITTLLIGLNYKF